MVRRRSTVRFRKGAPSSWVYFERGTEYLAPVKWHFEWQVPSAPLLVADAVDHRVERFLFREEVCAAVVVCSGRPATSVTDAEPNDQSHGGGRLVTGSTCRRRGLRRCRASRAAPAGVGG
jgi:hypothetical protein